MGSPDLLLICGLSFLSVFLILSLLALVMHVITWLLPHKEKQSDAALYAAITATAAQQYPIHRISKIEELK